jgi:cysteine desulfurase
LIYLDWASTAPLCEAAKNAIIEHIDDFGNPSSAHELGRQARVLIEDARERIAKCINAEPDEIYFTSGGSEANTWALNQHYYMADTISTNFEHHSVHTGRTVPVNKDGFLDPHTILQRINPMYDIVSCMYVNNEIGTIQPIKEIAKTITTETNIWFHTDAVQAMPYITIDVKDLMCDMLSASGHKFGAPKGIGFLFAKDWVKIKPLIYGGKQELGARPGTENVLGIISMAAALEDAIEHMDERNKHIKHLRDKLLDKLLQIPDSHLNGSLENRVPGNINIQFSGVSGSKLVALCSLYGVYISSGSACNEGVSEPSHVLKAIGLTDEEALSSVRITIGHINTEEEIDQTAKIITALVERIRSENE